MKRISLFFALLLTSFLGYSQTKGINYQAVIIDPNPIEIPGRDVSAQPYVNKEVWLRFTISQDGATQYQEIQKTKTDNYGLVNLTIGTGINTGKGGTFASLNWAGNVKNIVTEVSFTSGANYVEVGNQKLNYVPYSLFSETANKLAGVLPISAGGTGAITSSAAKVNLGLDKVDNTSDVDKPVSTATLAILDTKESLSNKSTNIEADSASLVKYPSVKAIKDYIDNRNSATASNARLAAKASALETPRTINGIPFDGTANITIPVGVTPPDADASTKGLVQLAGDLSGTAASPAIAAGAVTTTKITDGAVTDAKIATVSGSKVTGNITGNAANVTGTVAIANGGTGATTAAGARTNLGLVIGTDVLAQRSFGTAANSAATDFIPVTEKAANNGVATLGNDGKIPSVQIPAISFQNVSVVNSASAMTSIAGAQVGSIAIRTDNNNNYVLSALPASTLSNWIALATPIYVSTINGFAGPNVVLTTNDVAEGNNNKYYTDARVRGAISATGPLSYNASTGNFSMTAASGSANGYLSSADFTTFNNKQTALTAGVDYATPSGNITGNAANVTGIVSIVNGGTGTSTASGALLTLGAEPSANKSNDILVDGNSTTKFPTFKAIKDYVDQQSANAGVADNSITSAKINGSLAVLKGGTGATTAAGARTNLGLVIGTDVMAANFTTTLTGDVTGSGNGSFATTVNAVGGVSSATISTLPTSVSANTASITANTAAILLKAPIASPAFTGTPTAPTPTINDNSTKVATTEYVKSNLATVSAGTLTGTTLASTITGSSLTSVGTITSGVWSGTAISNDKLANSTTILGSTTLTLGGTVTSVTGLTTLEATNLTGNLSGTATTATNLAGGVSGSIPYQTGAGTTAMIPVGSANQFLTSVAGGTYTWTSASAVTGNYVPYTGANGAVNLGAYDLTVNGLKVGLGNSAEATNTAIGAGVLAFNNNSSGWGTAQTAIGYYALYNNTTGYSNTAVGYNSLKSNTTGGVNTGLGLRSLEKNTTGSSNLGLGGYAAYNNTTGSFNIAMGINTLYSNTTGSRNIGIGSSALYNMVGGNNNLAIGSDAGKLAGSGAGVNLTNSNQSLFIGAGTRAGTNTSTNEIVIGQDAIGNGSNTVTVGNLSTTANYFNGDINLAGNINGGTWSGTSISVAKGGTGATTAADARTNLGLAIGTDVMAANATTTLTGDVTGSGNGSFATTLANSGVASGTYGSSTAIPVLTVDTKGRVTSASTVGIIAGVNSLNYTSTISYAAGGTISGTALTLTAADGTNPGLISTGAQTIAGAKTFSNDLTAPNFIGNVTGTVTGNLSGTANTATNLAGGVSGSIPFQTAAGVTSMIPTGQANQILTSTGSGTYTWTSVTNVTGNSVPYSGATGAVNLGAYDLTVNGLTVGTGVNGSTLSNTAFGVGALAGNNSGIGKNTAIGYSALNKNTSGQWNTAVGYNALLNQVSTAGSTAIGSQALEKNIANGNTAVGTSAGYFLDNSLFTYNSFFGYNAGARARGANNIAIGNLALQMNNSGSGTGGDNNIAIGNNTLATSSKPVSNVVIGDNAGYGFTVGSWNTILGQRSGYDMTAGYHNTILGDSTGLGITTGSRNTIIGAKVTGLSPTLTGNIILADGAGNIRAQHDGTGWSLGTISSGVWSGTAIANNKLANSSTILGSTTMTLGGTVTSVTGLTSLAATNLTGTLSGTATSLATGRTIALTGDVTYTSPAFDGSGDVTAAATLAASGVASGTYGSSTAIPVLTVDSKGRVTSASTVGIIAGVNSLNYTSTTSYAAGGTISGTSLTLAAADGTNPGLISTGAQTIAGAKTFNSDLVVNGMTVGKGGGNVSNNTALGFNALTANVSSGTPGINNTAVGYNSLSSNTTGGNNVAIGNSAGSVNVGGSNNVFIGNNANAAAGLVNNANAIAIGSNAIVDAPNKIQLGDQNITAVNTSGTITAAGFTGPLSGNATTATTAGNITATSNTTLTSLANLATVGTITTGTWSATEIAIAKGGTGATTAADARTNLGLGSLATKSTIANADVASGAAIDFSKLNITKADITSLGIQDGLTAGSGISISSGVISATGLTTANLSSTAGITNAQLANSSTTLGSTTMTLGGTVTSVTGLTSLAATNLTGTLSGTATSLATARTIALTGDVTYTSPAFDGSGNVTAAATLAASGVNSGTYGSSTAIPVLTVDTKGRITTASTVSIVAGVNTVTAIAASSNANGATISGTALTLTPADASNGGVITTGAQTFAGTKTFANTITATSALAKGTIFSPTLNAAANNDVLVGVDISPTYSIGAYTGVSKFALRSSDDIKVNGLTIGLGNGNTPLNTVLGVTALSSNAGGSQNVAVGLSALGANSTGSYNTAVGYKSMISNTTGNYNTALGFSSLYLNTTASDNTSIGNWTMFNNTTGARNTVVGSSALYTNTTGKWNTAVGYNALYYNVTADQNTAVGYEALKSTTSAYNTAVGYSVLSGNSTGTANTGMGNLALGSNTSGSNNAAFGATSLRYNLTGSDNAAFGQSAGANSRGSQNTYIGSYAGYNAYTVSNNIFIGYKAGYYYGTLSNTNNASGDGNIMIGTDVRPLADGQSNQIVIAGYTGSGAGQEGLGTNTTSIGNSATTDTRIFGKLNLPNTTASTSTTTGALIVSGGAGIAGNVNVGGALAVTGATTLTGAATISNTTASTSSTTGALVVRGGVGVAGNVSIGGTIEIDGGTPGLGKVLTSDAGGVSSWTYGGGATSTKTGAYTILLSDKYVFFGTAATGAATFTLPAATGNDGKEIIIKNKSTFTLTIQRTGSETIFQENSTGNSAATSITLGIESSNNWVKLVSDGTQWVAFRGLF